MTTVIYKRLAEIAQRVWSSRSLRALLILVSVAPFAYALVRRWRGTSEVLRQANWPVLILAVFGLCIILPLMGAISWFTLRSLSQRLQFAKALVIYFLSQVPKYLPGGFWAFPGRMVAYRAAGVERSRSVVSVLREVAVLFSGAAMVGGLGLAIGLPISPGTQVGVGIGLGVSVAGLLVSQTNLFWRIARKVGWAEPGLEGDGLAQVPVSLNQVLGSLLASLLFWLMLGFPFHELAVAVSPAAQQLNWIQCAALFSISWCAGFIVLFAPAGLGIREVAMAGLLGASLGSVDALGIALLARLWWTLAEAFWVGVSLVSVGMGLQLKGTLE